MEIGGECSFIDGEDNIWVDVPVPDIITAHLTKEDYQNIKMWAIKIGWEKE